MRLHFLENGMVFRCFLSEGIVIPPYVSEQRYKHHSEMCECLHVPMAIQYLLRVFFRKIMHLVSRFLDLLYLQDDTEVFVGDLLGFPWPPNSHNCKNSDYYKLILVVNAHSVLPVLPKPVS